MMKINNVYMKIIRIFLIIILFATPSYASDWGYILKGIADGMSAGLENQRKSEEINLLREQRLALEQERLAREKERRIREEQEAETNKFFSYMDKTVPDWKQIAADPDFREWLNENDKMKSLQNAFIALNQFGVSMIFDEYKESLKSQRSLTTTSNQNEVKLIKKGGVYEVPVILNDALSIYFILDSGASDVSISPDVALTLIRTKTIKSTDWLPGAYYKFADGTTAKSERFKLKSVKIGNIELNNVTCSISNSIEAPMLLGQSALQKLKKYSIDYDNNVMIFNNTEKQIQAGLMQYDLNTCENKCRSLHKKKNLQVSCTDKCKRDYEFTENKLVERNSSTTTILSKDGSFKIKLPDGWLQGTPSSPSQQLYAENPLIDAALMISSININDVQDWKAYAESIRLNMINKLSQSTSSEMREIKIGRFDALQADIGATSNGIKIHFLGTIIKTDKQLIKMLTWCMESRFEANRIELQSLAKGLEI